MMRVNQHGADGPRPCTAADLPGVIALVDAAMRGGTDQSMRTDYPLVYRDDNLENIRVISLFGEVVSVVPFLPRDVVLDDCRFRIGIISPTATAPAHRKKGFGLRCLQSCIEQMARTECDLSVLWTLAGTFPFYEHGGYQAVRCQGAHYICGPDAGHLFADNGEQIVELARSDSSLLSAIRSAHEREAHGVLRAPDEYPALFGLPGMRTLVALRNGRFAAYLLVSRAVNKPGLIEAGGEDEAVESLVRRATIECGADEPIRAHVNLSETVLERVLARRIPDRREWTPASMMVRINNPASFFRKIASVLEKRNQGFERAFSIRIVDSRETLSFRFSKTGLALGADRLAPHFEMSLREWTSVVFGEHPARPVPAPEAMQGLFPLYFPVWVLDRS